MSFWEVVYGLGRFVGGAILVFCVFVTLAVLSMKMDRKVAQVEADKANQIAMRKADVIIALAEAAAPAECSDGIGERLELTCRLHEERIEAAKNFQVLYRMKVDAEKKKEAYGHFMRAEDELARYERAASQMGSNIALLEWQADYAFTAYRLSASSLTSLCKHSDAYVEECAKEGL